MKLGVIGMGRVFDHYMKIVSSTDSASIVAAYDISDDISRKKSPSLSTAAKCGSIDEILGLNVDLYCILTPSGTHYKIASELLRMGKNVLVEKPITLIPSQAEELLSLSSRFGGRLYCAFQNRFNKAVEAARDYLKDGQAIGNVVSCHVSLEWCRFQEYYSDEWHGTWSMDGGVIAQQAIHHIDAAMYLLGRPHRVLGLGRRVENNLEAEDTFTGLIDLENGLTITLSASTAFRPDDREARIKINGTKGFLDISGIAINKLLLQSSGYTIAVDESLKMDMALVI